MTDIPERRAAYSSEAASGSHRVTESARQSDKTIWRSPCRVTR
jgi:hypothetical protein